MCPDFGDFLPLRRETITTIRARMDADANAGIPTDDDRYIDLTPGGFYWDLTQVVALEIERLWDMASTEIPAVMFVTYAWGDYLDMHGDVLGVLRKPEAFAVGTVRFSGPDGTVIAQGTQVETGEVDPNTVPVTVATTETVTITGGTAVATVQATEAGAAGNVASGVLTELATALEGVTVTNDAALTNGAEVESDEDYRNRLVADLTAPRGAGNIADYRHMALEYPGVGFVTVEPLWDGNNTVRLIVMDDQNNPVSQPVVDGLQTLLDPQTSQTTLTAAVDLPVGTINVADTTGFRTPPAGQPQRIHIGTQSVTYTGMTGTSFTGCTGGSGHWASGHAVTQGGEGLGEASIGHDVMVATGSLLPITVVATIIHRPGYSLDGDAGTIATRVAIETAVAQYIDSLPPGEDVVLQHVIAAIFQAEGVYDVTGVTLNGSAANVVAAPLQVATVDTHEGGAVTLT